MKKELLSKIRCILVTTLLLTVGNNYVFASDIPMQIINQSPAHGGHTYAPPRPWYITQDDYVLTLPSFEDGFTLELRDEDGTVVYSTDVPAGTTTVVLPSTLSGEYELRLIPFSATYYYRGYINL